MKITYKLTCTGNVFCVNVIEMLWAALKHHLRKYVKPTNKEELVEGIKDFWSKQCRSQGHCFVGGGGVASIERRRREAFLGGPGACFPGKF